MAEEFSDHARRLREVVRNASLIARDALAATSRAPRCEDGAERDAIFAPHATSTSKNSSQYAWFSGRVAPAQPSIEPPTLATSRRFNAFGFTHRASVLRGYRDRF